MLTADQFSQLLERLDPESIGDASFPGSEKRRAPRVELRNRATIVPYVDGMEPTGVGVEVRDFSARGIRFLHSSRLEKGSQFVLELSQRGEDPLRILCTVMHCRPSDEGPISIGAEFTCVLRKTSLKISKSDEDRIRQSILG
jgi:hypothetical protein